MEEPVKDLKHFNHEHPLEYTKSGFEGKGTCSGCRLTIMPNNFFYQCKVCRFSLHKVCYSMPEKVMHPADRYHLLTLSALPSTNQTTQCNACGRHIAGFCYSCTRCSSYYHMLCIAMPLSVKIPSSHPHILKLELKPPYDFQCDLCDRPSYSGWLYRCKICEFDAHVSCAVTFKDSQSPDHGFRLQISSLQDNTRTGPKSHPNELMELLSEGMKGNHVENERNLDEGQFQSTDQPIDMISDNFTLPSCNFSDACFSIDIAKSIQIKDKTNEANREACHDHQAQIQETKRTVKDWAVTDSIQKLEVGQRRSFSSSKRDLKRELSLAPSTGIRSRVWQDLGQESKNKNLDVTNYRMRFKDQVTKTENMTSRRPFWLKLLACF